MVVVTPCGRRRYLEVLAPYILRLAGLVDEWRLWMNTTNPDDIAFLLELERSAAGFIKVEYPSSPVNAERPGYSIHQFFRNCTDPHTVYIRCDDDLVYMRPDAVENLLRFRLANRHFFLVFANVVNNAICTHIHQRLGAVGLGRGAVQHWCLDPLGWKDPDFAVDLHRDFLRAIQVDRTGAYLFPRWELWDYPRFSINCFAFLGAEFLLFGGHVGEDEEWWLTEHKPREIQKHSCVCGDALVAHYAFFTQRDAIDQTDVLAQYRALAPILEKFPKFY